MEVRYVTDRHDTLCAKYRQDYRDNPDYLYCGVADMDLAPPEPVLEAMKRRLDHGVFGYTELPDGYEKLVSDWMREQYHCEVKQEWVLFSPGSTWPLTWRWTPSQSREIPLSSIHPPILR